MTGYEGAFNACEIDLGALARNYKKIAEFSKAPVMGVVKGDAYGHGLVPSALALVEAGCRELGVLDVWEAMELKKHPIEAEITILAGLLGPEQSYRAVSEGLVVFAYDLAQIKTLAKAAENLDTRARIIFKIDTGMGRLGFGWEKASYIVSSLAGLKNLSIEGLSTHLATNGDEGAKTQLERFYDLGDKIRKRTKTEIKFSVLASGGILAHQDFPDNLSRAGLLLYGYSPLELTDPALTGMKKAKNLINSLEKPMTIKSKLIQVREAKAGETISYDRTFVVPKTMKIGTAPIGYVHGIGRSRSALGHALIGGQKAGLLGRVCMNLCLFDLGNNGQAKVGDEVVILGDQGHQSIGANLIGTWEKTSAYEILCHLGRLNPRFYKKSLQVKGPKKRA
ncbi:MAG: alanine racemase [Deltaproteobacteria bacterium]|jgi:alanine racemase|nr:alanine racemase [Deltaproteobacteria bacterium]